ncbi:uncharacterized protein PAE49_006952 [Odontesthes bonariensis]
MEKLASYHKVGLLPGTQNNFNGIFYRWPWSCWCNVLQPTCDQLHSVHHGEGTGTIMPITNIAASINDEEENRLHEEGFIQIPPDLNSGAAANIIHLWYETGDSAPITRIQLSFNDEMSNGLLTEGYQRVHPSLNTGGSGNNIYLWFCRGSTEYDVPIEELCRLMLIVKSPRLTCFSL